MSGMDKMFLSDGGGLLSRFRLKEPRLKLPGFGLPVNHMPELWSYGQGGDEHPRCPHALEWSARPITVRERNMMSLINQISDKFEWRRKVFDEEIVAKWRREAVTEEGQGFTEKMFDYCLSELRYKAGQHEDTDMMVIFDSQCDIVKSDTIISLELKEELKSAVEPVENIPDRLKDWHPGSNEQVLDLVHPSLFPLVYGLSRILPMTTIGLKDCVRSCGDGETIPSQSEDEVNLSRARHIPEWEWDSHVRLWSLRFQWLPCEVAFTGHEDVKITSYINNLHPVHHENVYGVIEKIIAKAVPLWSQILGSFEYRKGKGRIMPVDMIEYEYPLGEVYPRQEGETSDDEDFWERSNQWIRANRILIKPDARIFSTPTQPSKPFDLREKFAQKGLQVIVKLANIHLTPSSPKYPGGSWHIEGQLNEHICASALYYYDEVNITPSHLAFRQSCCGDDLMDVGYEQEDHEGLEYLWDIEQNGPTIQDLGTVLTREGRLLAWPNVLQHQVQPFELQDESKPGHRKILALFLVDPFQHIISTANVPPQRKDWWTEEVMKTIAPSKGKFAELPPELMQNVLNGVDGFPISLEKAKDIRTELMGERSVFVQNVDRKMHSNQFNFCEH